MTVQWHGISNGKQYGFQRIEGISADASDVSLDAELIGGYIFSAKVVTSADDAVTVTIKDHDGVEIAGGSATTAATSGEWLTISDRYPINGTPTYTISGLTSGTLILEVTVAKQ